MKIYHQIFIAIILGILVGWLFPETALSLSFIGEIFKKLLLMLIAPLVFFSITAGIVTLGGISEIRELGTKTTIYFLSTTAIAAMLGLVLVNWVRPGVNQKHEVFQENVVGSLSKDEREKNIQKVQHLKSEPATVSQFLTKQIDSIIMNPFTAMSSSQNILAVIFFAFLFGLSLLVMGENSSLLKKIIESANQSMMVIVEWMMYIAPFGVFSLMSVQIAKMGLSVLFLLAKFMLTVMAGLGIHGLIILPLILYIFTRTSIITFFSGVRENLLVALSTSSSNATLPVSIRAVEQNLKVPAKISRFVLPLGATVNMDGTALYEAVAALFIAQLYGIDLDFTQQVIVCITAMLASIGAAGIPSAGMVTMVMVLQSVGLPIEGIGILLAVDRFLDMFRTAVNVEGDCVGAVILSHYDRKEHSVTS